MLKPAPVVVAGISDQDYEPPDDVPGKAGRDNGDRANGRGRTSEHDAPARMVLNK